MKKAFSLFCFLLCSSLWAQQSGGDLPSKLAKEQGFEKLKIGATFNSVKQFLQKSSLTETLEKVEPGEFIISSVYLVKKEAKEYKKFCGLDIERIEVYTNTVTIKEKKQEKIFGFNIYLKRPAPNDVNSAFASVTKAYGMPVSALSDFPAKGDFFYTWMTEKIMMSLTTSFEKQDGKTSREYIVVKMVSTTDN